MLRNQLLDLLLSVSISAGSILRHLDLHLFAGVEKTSCVQYFVRKLNGCDIRANKYRIDLLVLYTLRPCL